MKNQNVVVDILSQHKGYNMIHGIYLKSRPKAVWHLVSVAITPEAANHDLSEFLKQAKIEGNDRAEVAVQVFDSAFYIPEILHEIKDQKIMYN